LLNLLASNSNARILSSPKIMARNGETATIQVGEEVPVITSQQSNANTTGGVLQTVQYRNTGVILKVRPIIHSGSRLDLEVSQEVSEAGRTATGVTSSPTISTRKVDTKLTLRDGSTVLLAGLIKSTANQADTGIPIVKDVPILGNLFKSSGSDTSRTELIVLITPYVVNDEYEAESITEAFKGTLGDWVKEVLPAQPLLKRPAPSAELQRPVEPALNSAPGGAFSNEVTTPGQKGPVDASPVPNNSDDNQKNPDGSSTSGVEFSRPTLQPDANKGVPVPHPQATQPKNNGAPLTPDGAGKIVTDEDLLRDLRKSLQPKK
jgi:general secretion pathway protein D